MTSVYFNASDSADEKRNNTEHTYTTQTKRKCAHACAFAVKLATDDGAPEPAEPPSAPPLAVPAPAPTQPAPHLHKITISPTAHNIDASNDGRCTSGGQRGRQVWCDRQRRFGVQRGYRRLRWVCQCRQFRIDGLDGQGPTPLCRRIRGWGNTQVQINNKKPINLPNQGLKKKN
jgi:hypothetical protein